MIILLLQCDHDSDATRGSSCTNMDYRGGGSCGPTYFRPSGICSLWGLYKIQHFLGLATYCNLEIFAIPNIYVTITSIWYNYSIVYFLNIILCEIVIA